MPVAAADLDLDLHRDQYVTDGFTVLRGVMPADLLARMRVAAEALRDVTRRLAGPGITRPPGGFVGGRLVQDYGDVVDADAFAELDRLPAVRAFLAHTLGDDFTNDLEAFTMLFEAEDRSIVQGWHRDYRDNVHWVDLDRWRELTLDVRWFCQFNAALYHDVSLWIVPGTHVRDDTPEEAAVIRGEGPVPAPVWGDMSPEAYVLQGERYLRSMPGAVQVVLAPGDIAVYRDSAIHLGCYIPTMKRATLHGHFENDETRRFFEEHFTHHHPAAPRDAGTVPDNLRYGDEEVSAPRP